MATSGIGLFASDSAQELLEEFADLSQADRVAELERIIRGPLDSPSELMRQFFPEEVIAASSLIALSLPGGEAILQRQNSYVSDLVEEARLEDSAAHLASDALRALAFVTDPHGVWSRTWRSAEDGEQANAEIDLVKELLRG